MSAVIACRGVAKWYGEVPALVAVSFDVSRGERVALFGGNGAGKTTLIRLIATLATPSDGAIQVAGGDTNRHGAAARARIGFVGHEPGIYGDLSVDENLQFFARLYGVRPRDERIEALVVAAGLER